MHTIIRLSAYFFAVFPIAFAFATVHFVEPGGSIQEAIAVCLDGDTIVVEDGDYPESLVIAERSLTLGSRFALDANPAHITATVLRGSYIVPDSTSCIVIANSPGQAVRLIGLTFSEGRGTYSAEFGGLVGGALAVSSDASLEYCKILNSNADYGGGFCAWSPNGEAEIEFSMTSCVIESCSSATYGGGGRVKQCDFSAHEVEFRANTTVGSGGGLYIENGTQNVSDCVFEHNSGQIGGMYVSRGQGIIERCVFSENGGDDTGVTSHLNCSGGARLIVRHCDFRSSVGGNIAVLLYGRQTDSIPDFYGNVIESNNSYDLTGSVAMITGFGRIHHNVIANNQNANGGALYIADGANVRIDHNVIRDNMSETPSGGSILQVTSTNYIRLDSNWFAGNGGTTMTCSIEQGCAVNVHAENNWWGEASGPYDPVRNPTGQGDTLGWDRVIFEPWLTEPPDTGLQVARPTVPHSPVTTWQLLNLYPNPFNNTFQLEITGFARGEFMVRLYDLLGREVALLYAGRVESPVLTVAAPAALASGVYFVRAADAAQAMTRKVVLLK